MNELGSIPSFINVVKNIPEQAPETVPEQPPKRISEHKELLTETIERLQRELQEEKKAREEEKKKREETEKKNEELKQKKEVLRKKLIKRNTRIKKLENKGISKVEKKKIVREILEETTQFTKAKWHFYINLI